MMSKESAMFKTGSHGELIPDEVEIKLYDRKLDDELMEEAIVLSDWLTKVEAQKKVNREIEGKIAGKINELKAKRQSLISNDYDEIEILAEIEHVQWEEWSKDISSKESLSTERVERWKTYWKVYNELPHEVKEQDRKYAKIVLDRLKEKGFFSTSMSDKLRQLDMEIETQERVLDLEKSKARLMVETMENKISDERKLIVSLKEEKLKQTSSEYVMAIPCTVGECAYVFGQGKTIEGKETQDWLSDLISRKIKVPQFTYEEAVLLMKDFRLALRDAIADISGWKTVDYRDVLTQSMFSEPKKNSSELDVENSTGNKLQS